jgi:AcrR family transcriptional regulator
MSEETEPLQGKAATQDRILNAAGLLFVRSGYDRTTIADIAQAAGVSRATIFWHFGDKAGLFRETFSKLLVPFRESVSRELDNLAPEKKLEHQIAGYLDFLHEHWDVVYGFVRWALESETMRNEILDALLQLHQHLCHAVTEVLRETLPPGHDPAAVASGLCSMLHGSLLLGLFGTGERPWYDGRPGAAAILEMIPHLTAAQTTPQRED